MKGKESCVELNIYVECEKCIKHDGKGQYNVDYKPEEDETCVSINVYVECEKEKKKSSHCPC